MTVGAGFNSQVMVAEETTFATFAAPTRTLELVQESLKLTIDRIRSKSLRQRRILTSAQSIPGKRSVAGDLQLELGNVGQGILWKHALGAVATAGTGPDYRHTFTPGDINGKSLTVQVGRPDISGTIQPFTYLGTKVNQWELSCKAGETADWKLSLVAADETTTQTLATPTYQSNLVPFTFVGGSLTTDASELDIADVTLKGDNKLDAQRWMLRANAATKEQLQSDLQSITGTLTADFESLAQYDHYLNADIVTAVLLFAGATIPGAAVPYHVQITLQCQYDGETPVVAGPGLLTLPIPFTVLGDPATTDASAITVEYQTSDAVA